MENNDKTNNEEYNISFFKPTTKVAKFNRNLIVTLVLIWAISIFGFQILLKIVEKQTPEKAYTEYKSVRDNLKNGNADNKDKQVFVQSLLSVLGKITVAEKDKEILNAAVNRVVFELVPETDKAGFIAKLDNFKSQKTSDPNYPKLKKELADIAGKYIGVKAYTLKAKLLVSELAFAKSQEPDFDKTGLVMKKYLIHNQSFITDFKFIGFPFHYFYTAVFLLILFVGLCLYYCIAIDVNMKKMGIVEE